MGYARLYLASTKPSYGTSLINLLVYRISESNIIVLTTEELDPTFAFPSKPYIVK